MPKVGKKVNIRANQSLERYLQEIGEVALLSTENEIKFAKIINYKPQDDPEVQDGKAPKWTPEQRQEALEKLMDGRTSLVIAHRLATIRKADKIIVLDKGKVIETGTHDELISNVNGLYRSLSILQFDQWNNG